MDNIIKSILQFALRENYPRSRQRLMFPRPGIILLVFLKASNDEAIGPALPAAEDACQHHKVYPHQWARQSLQ